MPREMICFASLLLNQSTFNWIVILPIALGPISLGGEALQAARVKETEKNSPLFALRGL
jgi:hypothetical protein